MKSEYHSEELDDVNILIDVIDSIHFSKTGWTDTSTEYYSTCGNDDYQAEQRDGARQYAVEMLVKFIIHHGIDEDVLEKLIIEMREKK